MTDMEGKRILAILICVVVFVTAIALVVGSRLQISGIAETDTVGYDYCTISFPGGTPPLWGGYGRFQDLLGDNHLRGEIWSTTRLWYSWFKDGESRPVVVEGRLKSCALPGLIVLWPDHAIYRFEYSENGATFVPFYQDRIPTGVLISSFNIPFGAADLNLGAFEIILDGYERCTVPTTAGCPAGKSAIIADGSSLRVSVEVYRVGFPGYGSPEQGDLIAQDEIELRSAIPEVTWGKLGYSVGDTARINYEIPTVSYDTCTPLSPDQISCETKTAYFLEILNMNTNAPLPGFNRIPLTATSGFYSIPITSAMISNDLATCQNRLRATIWTTIIRADLEETAVRPIDVSITGGDAPTITGISFDKAEYQEGDPVRISWTVSGSATKYHVTAHIGGLLVFDRDVSEKQVSFTAPRTGVLEVQITPYNLCTAGDSVKEQATVGNVFPGLCELFPELSLCAGERLVDLIIAGLAIIGTVAVFVIVFYVGSRILQSGTLGLLIALTASGIVAIALILSGVFDPLLASSMVQGVIN